jgi:hypoxanthine phosphoribosyltransferase
MPLPKVVTKKVAWDDVERWSADVSDKMYASGWIPDVIIAISRGGYIPSRLICDKLVVSDLVSLQIAHWPSAAQMAKDAVVKYPLECDLNHKRTLIMDDIADSGDSIILAKDYIWTTCRPDEIRVATLQWISGSSKVKPDYFAEEVKGWVWYQYPWTRLEDVIGFIKRVITEEKERKTWGKEDFVPAFRDWFGVTFSDWYMAKALEYLVRRGIITKDGELYSLKQ